MSRNLSYSALALRVRPSGESNREAWFLSAEEGLVKAMLFGGPKSRLRALVAPFHEGRLMLYHDPVRDSRKVSDFDVMSYRTGLRELYERAMCAGAIAETILSSQGGGGNWQEAAVLTGSVLDSLNEADAAACSRISVYFFWHWARILGLGLELSVCGSCSHKPMPAETLWFSARKEALLCENCLQNERSLITQGSSFCLDPGARLWLKEIESLPPAALAEVSLNTASLEQAKALSKALLTAALGKRLPSWDGI